MAIAYWTAASITLSVILTAFFQDKSASNANAQILLFIAVATLLWPVTLPCIVVSKLRAMNARKRAVSRLRRHLSVEGNEINIADEYVV